MKKEISTITPLDLEGPRTGPEPDPRLQVTFNQHEVDLHDVLECPNCGNDYLHHGEVVVWSRTAEDEGGVVAKVRGDGNASVQDIDAREFPARSRRNSMALNFSCEHCPADLQLHISQQKGRTFFYWERLADHPTDE